MSESTIKRWVDSGDLRAEKTLGRHRKIMLEDLVALLRRLGRSVPSLEALGLTADQASATAAEAPSPERFARLLLDGEMDIARSILMAQFQAATAMDEILDHLVAPAMSHVGMLWAEGRVNVYQEHVATRRVLSILEGLRTLLPVRPESAPLALGGAPEGDSYLLPSMMASLTLSELGWRTIDIGPETPIAALSEAMTRHAPRLIWISLTTSTPRPPFFDAYPRLFQAAQARGIRVMIGGQGLVRETQDRLVASAFGTRLAHLKAFAGTVLP